MKITENIKRDTTNKKVNYRDVISQNLQIISSVITILGISLIGFLGPLKNSIPFIQESIFRNKIEQIKVTQSKEYIDDIIGVPISTESIEYHLYNGDIEMGERSIYNNNYFFAVAYYRLDKSLLGYFIISKYDNFTPKIYRNTSIFTNSFRNCQDVTEGYLDIVAYGRGFRSDLSQYYIEFYYHHLFTNSCYIGIGISDLGYWEDKYQKLINEYEGFNGITQVNEDNIIKLTGYGKPFIKEKPNVFSVFYENEVDIYELFSRELRFGLAITHLEYNLLNE